MDARRSASLRTTISRTARAFVSLLALLSTTLAAGTLSPSPATRIDDTVTDYFGQKVADPYRWLENESDPDVARWFKEQNDYTRGLLDGLPGRAALKERLASLGAGAEQVRLLQPAAGHIFYLKRRVTSNQYQLFVREGLSGEERLLLDPAPYAVSGQPASIDYFYPSPNGRYVACGISVGGSEKASLHIFDVASGREVGTPLERAVLNDWEYPGFSWQMDSRSFFYNQLRERTKETPPTAYFQDSEARLHTLPVDGTAAVDVAVLSRATHPKLELAADDVPMVHVSPVSPYAIAVVKHGDQKELSLYAAPVTAIHGNDAQWMLIADMSRKVMAFELRGDHIYMLSRAGAPRGKLVRLSLSAALGASAGDPWLEAEAVIDPGEDVLTDLAVAKDALYVKALEDGYGKLLRLQFNVKIVRQVPTQKGKHKQTHIVKSAAPKEAGIASRRAVALPFKGGVRELATDPLQAGALVVLEGWNAFPRVYAVNGKSGAVKATEVLATPGIDLSSVQVTNARVRSHDGTLVPLSIIHRKGLKLDGRHPTLLSGYGAYGISEEPRPSPYWLAWLEHDGVIAVAHVRGGGEYGDEWHGAGQKLTKPNTWMDFIACAEWLIAKGYTDTPHLAGMGGSAGGILVGRAITERPDLFAAAVSNVGMSDTLRAETTPNGPPNIPEFGSTADEAGFRGLLAMSAYHHVRDGTPYPAVLLTTGINDPRVTSWEPGKLAARLQAASSSGKPVLLSVDFAGGHGGSNTREQITNELADRYAFLLWQMGVPEFQPPERIKPSQKD
jgi:prolyl oligopeptidase